MSEQSKETNKSRRDFLGKAFMGGGLIASGILGIRHLLAFVFPKMEPPEMQKLLVARGGELEEGEAKKFEIGGQRLFLLNLNGEYKVFSGICTHLGCQVSWEGYKDRFYCPCHKGIFAANGEVIDGPPPRPLDEFKVEMEDSLVFMWIEKKERRLT